MEKICKKEIQNEKRKDLLINNNNLLNNFGKYIINKEVIKNPNKNFFVCPFQKDPDGCWLENDPDPDPNKVKSIK